MSIRVTDGDLTRYATVPAQQCLSTAPMAARRQGYVHSREPPGGGKRSPTVSDLPFCKEFAWEAVGKRIEMAPEPG